MGSFQASMLEAFQSLRDEFTSKKQVEVDQTSASASKPGPSNSAVNLNLPPPIYLFIYLGFYVAFNTV